MSYFFLDLFSGILRMKSIYKNWLGDIYDTILYDALFFISMACLLAVHS